MEKPYCGMIIKSEEDQECNSPYDSLFERMAKGDPFSFTLFSEENGEPVFHEEVFKAKILRVSVAKDEDYVLRNLVIECDTLGCEEIMGIKHGKYTLDFDEDLVCDNLPDEMFE